MISAIIRDLLRERFFIGAGEKQPELHTPEYDFPDSLLRIAPELLAAIAREPELAK